MSDAWHAACPLADLPPGSRKLIKIESVDIALFNLAGTIYAIKNRCPHRSGPLIRGFVDPTGGIKCPMHGWRFDLRDGSSERPAQATTYPTKIENGYIYLAFPSPRLD